MSRSLYKETYPEELIKLMKEGKSILQVAAHFGVTKRTMVNWAEQHADFKIAKEMGKELAEAYWEDLGQKGIKGVLQKFNPMAWSYYMKTRFKEDWVEANNQKIELVDSVKRLSKEELDKKVDQALNFILAARNKNTTNNGGSSCQL